MFLYNDCLKTTIINGAGINQPQNIRRACELGIDLDGGPDINNIKSVNNISNDTARRKIISTNSNVTLSSVNDSFESTGTGSYGEFRKQSSFGTMYLPTNNSFYFYFGINAGKSAIEKANIKYFADCTVPVKDDFLIKSVITNNTVIGGSSGSINIEIIGGTGPFTFLWSNGQITKDVSGLMADTYNVIVSDKLGNKINKSFEISEPAPLTIVLNGTNVTTNGATDGIITVSGIGGISPYTATILTGPSNVGSIFKNFLSPIQFDGLAKGTYKIGLIDSSITPNTVSSTISISEPSIIILETTKKDITCFGNNNGSINNKIKGGVPPYVINTTGPSNYLSTRINQNSLLAGTYNIMITDSIQQTLNSTVNILEPLKLTLTLNYTIGTTTTTGEIYLTGLGGTGLLTFQLLIGDTEISTNNTGHFINLESNDNYIVKLKDENSCMAIKSGIEV
jgi:hypothetical protein